MIGILTKRENQDTYTGRVSCEDEYTVITEGCVSSSIADGRMNVIAEMKRDNLVFSTARDTFAFWGALRCQIHHLLDIIFDSFLQASGPQPKCK